MPSALTQQLYQSMTLPVMAAPMFIVSNPALVIAQCASGIIGSVPALNARPQEKLKDWLDEIDDTLSELLERHPERRIAPYAINHIIHQSNDRLEQDLRVCADHKVPLVITSLRAPHDIVTKLHAWCLKDWADEIDDTLAELRERHPERRIAPYAINHIIHQSNDRLEQDLRVCADHKVPLVITSLRAPQDIVPHVHAWGGKVFHDVTTLRHAEKALEAGVDGLIVVAAGAGGHAGTLSPFVLVNEIRQIFDGPIALSGAMSRGRDILATQAMGADMAY